MHDLDVLSHDFAVLPHLPDKGGVVRLRGRGWTCCVRVRCRGKGGPRRGEGRRPRAIREVIWRRGGRCPRGRGRDWGRDRGHRGKDALTARRGPGADPSPRVGVDLEEPSAGVLEITKGGITDNPGRGDALISLVRENGV